MQKQWEVLRYRSKEEKLQELKIATDKMKDWTEESY